MLGDKVLNMCTINMAGRRLRHNAENITRREVISSDRFSSIDKPHIVHVLRGGWFIVFLRGDVGIDIISRWCNVVNVCKEKVIG
jgi:hypothetical protein